MRDRIGTNDLANGAVRYGVYDAAGSLLRYEWLRPEDGRDAAHGREPADGTERCKDLASGRRTGEPDGK